MKPTARYTGFVCVFASAAIFGFTPVLAALSYHGGNNGLNMAFLRALLPLPVFFVLAKQDGGVKPLPEQRRMGTLLGFLLFGCILLLYSSYAYLPVGVATALHFLYPLYVTCYEMLAQKAHKSVLQLIGLGLSLAGALLFIELGEAGMPWQGLALALLSGVCYAAYVIMLAREARHPLPLPRLMLIVSTTGAVFLAAIGLLTKRLTFCLSPVAWVCAGAAALLTAVVGCILFQIGVRRVGKTNAAVFSLMEPICGILFGLWLMNDRLPPRSLTSCVLIVAGLLCIALSERR